jgi:hypothetical protein
MLTRLHGATFAAPIAEEMTGERPEINSHTFLGLGLMALTILAIWLIRRLRA